MNDEEIFQLCMFQDNHNCDAFRACLDRNPKCAEYETLLGSSPLHFVALGGNIATANLLVKYNADIDATNYGEETPLHWACKGGSVKMVQFLIDMGADIDAEDEILCTPLHWATDSGHHDIVKLLLANGAQVSRNQDEETPLQLAQHNCDIDMFRILLCAVEGFNY